ncbi:hypothetical protein P7C73_g6807, partial [Tremellales sp. Uapishka_1]
MCSSMDNVLIARFNSIQAPPPAPDPFCNARPSAPAHPRADHTASLAAGSDLCPSLGRYRTSGRLAQSSRFWTGRWQWVQRDDEPRRPAAGRCAAKGSRWRRGLLYESAGDPKPDGSGVGLSRHHLFGRSSSLTSPSSDAYDYLAPALATFTNPSSTPSPTSLPITSTHFLLILLPPTLLLPLLPSALIPYFLLPLGILPPLVFHPALSALLYSNSFNRTYMLFRSRMQDILMNDSLSDALGRKDIRRVEVWENERLDTTSKNGTWSAKNLRAGERTPWVKVQMGDSLWREKAEREEKLTLDLSNGCEFVDGEEWRVDLGGEWSEVGLDHEGWVYMDDSWQNPAVVAWTEGEGNSSSLGMPGLTIRRITRRRRWFRRVCSERIES